MELELSKCTKKMTKIGVNMHTMVPETQLILFSVFQPNNNIIVQISARLGHYFLFRRKRTKEDTEQ